MGLKDLRSKENTPGILNQEINLDTLKNIFNSKKTKNTKLGGNSDSKLPSKKYMNLYVSSIKTLDMKKVIPLVAVGCIVFLILCKLFVIDLLLDYKNVKATYLMAETEHAQMMSELEDYNKVQEEYYRYTDGYKNDEEKILADRLEILDLIKRATYGLGSYSGISISGNTVIINISTADLNKAAAIREKFKDDYLVEKVTVYTADKSEESGIVNSSFNVVLKDVEYGGGY